MTEVFDASTPESLAPQLQAYTRLGRTLHWRPFLMFGWGGGVRSEVVNTDRHGFRWTILSDGSVASVESPPAKPCGLLMGGSTAFGIGAASDAGTVASSLAAVTGRPWLNFGARGHCSTQELLAFVLYADVLPPAHDVVLLSGVNDLYIQYASNHFDDQLGAFLYSDRFFDAVKKGGSAFQRLLGAFRRRDGGEPRRSFEDLLGEREERRERTLAVLRRNLSHWAALAASRSTRVLFALQPTFPWMGKRASPEEEALFSARAAQDSRHEQIVTTVLEQRNHDWFAPAVEKMCADLGVGFLDLNRSLRAETSDDEWLFVDRAHMNDRGYAASASAIATRLS